MTAAVNRAEDIYTKMYICRIDKAFSDLTKGIIKNESYANLIESAFLRNIIAKPERDRLIACGNAISKAAP